MILFLILSAMAGTPCVDGTISSSSGPGTCSHHGGIQEESVQAISYWVIPYEGNGRGPTLCADGMWSNSDGLGTCSYHGGISSSYGDVYYVPVPPVPNYYAFSIPVGPLILDGWTPTEEDDFSGDDAYYIERDRLKEEQRLERQEAREERRRRRAWKRSMRLAGCREC